MYVANAKYGDTRGKQSKLQQQRRAEAGSGKRRRDPAIHATSRPWHTSAPGIKMNVSTLAQIASQDKVAAKYLNQMKLSELAQKKRGHQDKYEGRGIDKMGRAVLAGQRHAQGRGAMSGAPNADRIQMWQADLMGRERAAAAAVASAEALPEAQAAAVGPRRAARAQAEVVANQQGNLERAGDLARSAAEAGNIDAMPLLDREYNRQKRILGRATQRLKLAHDVHSAAQGKVMQHQSNIARGSDHASHVGHIRGLRRRIPKGQWHVSGAHNPYF